VWVYRTFPPVCPFNRLAKSVGLSAEQTATLSTALPIAGAAIAGIAAVATGAAAGLFALTKSAADFGSSINDISEKTGLSTQTISALKLAADQSGSSLGEVSGSITKFTRLIGESAKGNEKATATLKALGIDGSKAVNDLDGAFAQAVKRINALPPGVQQVNASIDAFGKSGANVIPVINAMNGNVDEFIKKARELGVILSREDVQAADAFGDQLDVLKSQAGGVAFQFTKGLMPAVTEAMREISRYITANQETFRQWGESIGKYVKDTVKEFKKTDGTWQEAGALLARKFVGGFATILNKGINDAIREAGDQSRAEILRLLGRKEIGASNITEATSDTVVLPKYDRGGAEPNRKAKPSAGGDEVYLTNTKAVEDAKRAAEKAAKEAQKKREEYNRATLDGRKTILREMQEADNASFEKSAKINEQNFKAKSISDEVFRDAYLRNEARHLEGLKDLATKRSELENSGEKNPSKLRAAQIALENELNSIAEASAKRQADVEKLITETAKKNAEERVKISEDTAARLIAANKTELDTKLSQAEINHATGLESERDYRAKVDNLKYQSLAYERKINRELLASGVLSPEKAAEVEQSIKGIDEAIKQLTNAGAVKNIESFSKALSAVDDIFRDLNLSVGDFGKTTGLQDLNKLLADPEVTEALRKRAEALGWTVEQLKELLRVQQEGADKGLTTGTRPRKVEEPAQDRGEVSKGIDNIFGEDGDSKVNKAIQQGETLKGVFGSLSGVVQDAAQNMVKAFGSAIEGYILYGNSIGKALKQAAAAELAHIASVSAVKALYWTAQGIADLFFNPARAANDFAAAAGFAALAIGTGVAGRALASSSGMFRGDGASEAFKQQTKTGAGGAIQGDAGRSGSGNGGGYYTGGNPNNKPNILNEDRNSSPQIVEHRHVVVVESRDSHILRVVQENVNNRGDLHGLILKTAGS